MELQEKIVALSSELEKMAPNTRAMERLEGVESKLKSSERDFENARKQAKKARDQFLVVKEKRFELFNRAFTHISEQIGSVYKDLTKSPQFALGGQASVVSLSSPPPYFSLAQKAEFFFKKKKPAESSTN